MAVNGEERRKSKSKVDAVENERKLLENNEKSNCILMEDDIICKRNNEISN